MFKTLIISILCASCVLTSTAQSEPKTKTVRPIVTTFKNDESLPADLKIHPFKWGLFVGAGLGTLEGNLKTYFDTQMFVVDYGIHLDYRRYRFTLSLAGDVSSHHLLQSLDDNGTIRRSGLSLDYLWGQFSLGYMLLDGDTWRILPYAGLGIMEIADQNGKKFLPAARFKKDNYNLMGGLSIDYKFKKILHAYPNGSGVLFEPTLQLRIGMTHIALQQDLQGLSYLASIAYCTTLGSTRQR